MEQRFLKKSASAMSTFDELMRLVTHEIVTDQKTEEVAIVFGATPVIEARGLSFKKSIAGLPDFSWYNIPKRKKYAKLPQKYQMNRK
jgi:hypothetical protein